jgi:hypothetical protein
MMPVSEWLQTHLFSPLYEMTLLEKVVSIFIGFWFGIFPVPGMSTPLLFIGVLCINRYVEDPLTTAETTVCTAINLLSTPLMLILLPCWITLGQMLFGHAGSCDVSGLMHDLNSHGIIQTLKDFAQCLLLGVFAWLLYTPFFLSVALIFRGRSLIKARVRITELTSHR